jgi:transposase
VAPKRRASAVDLNSDVPAAVIVFALVCVEVMDVASVIIGIDPHKGSHTAYAIDAREKQLGRLRVRASARQAEVLLEWAAGWPTRSWAIEGARGLGHLLAQQLLAADQRVVDVPPKLAARVRLLNSGQINKNDENDARAVAVAALRTHDLPKLTAEDQTMVMRVWARRYHDLSRLRTQLVCRLHTVLCELVPGGVRKQLRTSQAVALVEQIVAESAAAQAKLDLVRELVTDLVRIDEQRRHAKQATAHAVAVSQTSTIGIYGVGPIVAGTVLGYVRDVRRFRSRDHFASYNGTAPIEVSSGDRKIFRLSRRGNRQLNHAIHMAALGQISHRGSEGRAYYEKKIAEGMTSKAALRALKRKISDALYQRMIDDARRVTGKGPGGQSGNDTASSAAGSHPDTPALRTSHSRATTNPKTLTDERMLAPRPAPDRRAPRRSATGVQVEPRPGPHQRARAGTTLTPASTGRQSPPRSRPAPKRA